MAARDGSQKVIETVSPDEFDEGWASLTASFNLPTGLTESGIRARYEIVWGEFSKMRTGTWSRTVRWYIQNAANDPWFPTPAQLLEAARQSYVPPTYNRAS